MDTRYGSWDYGKALPQEPKILLIDGVTKKWQPEWAATCVICTQEMSAYRLANPQPCRRTAQGTMDTRYGSWDYGKALP